jgi:hypothetical protein
MLALYVMCLIFGGVLVTLAIFSGDIDVDADIDVDVDVDAPVELLEVDGGLGAAGEGVGAAARFWSFRDLVFFTAFFGLSGTLFTALGVHFVITLATAVTVGSLAGISVHHVMGYLKASESGQLDDLSDLEGALAEVVIDIGERGPGKIAVKSGDRTHQLVARRHEAASPKRFRVNDPVVVVRVENGIAYIAESTFLS